MPSVKIKGMSCQHCVASVTEALTRIEGIIGVTVNLEAGEATYEESKPVAREIIRQAIKAVGFELI